MTRGSSTFQIWGSFAKSDVELKSPTTASVFRKGQLAGDGVTSMVELEREFSAGEGEVLHLLFEFDPIDTLASREVHEHMPSEEMENAMAFMVFDAFMAGWWRTTS